MRSYVTNRTMAILLLLTFPIQATPLQVDNVEYKVQSVWCKDTLCVTSSGITHRMNRVDGLHRVELPVATYDDQL